MLLPPPDVAAGAAIRREGDCPGLGAQSGVDERDVGQAITGHVFLQDAKNGRVRLKADDASLGVDVLEVKDRHAHVAPAVNDQRVGPLRLEVVDAADELVFVLHVEVGTVGDAEGVVQKVLYARRVGRVGEHAAMQAGQASWRCPALVMPDDLPDVTANRYG